MDTSPERKHSLAQVRHQMVGEPANPFRINSGRYGVCTTFWQTFESFQKPEDQVGEAAKANLAAIRWWEGRYRRSAV